jgi:hypothetical protein
MSTAKAANKQPQLPVILYEEPSGKNDRGISMPLRVTRSAYGVPLRMLS